MLVKRISAYSGIEHSLDLDITPEQLKKYNNGMSASKAFPDLEEKDILFIEKGITEEESELINGSEEIFEQ